MSRPPRYAPARDIADLAQEFALLGAAGRAILLQVANPGVGHGVADHSDFSHRAWDRLVATSTYLLAVVLGTEQERAKVVAAVNRAHIPVHSEGVHSDGYSAFDPQLQVWVAATLYDSAVRLYEQIFGPLDPAHAERIYQQYAVLGTALQVPAAAWPADRQAFGEYWDAQVAALRVDERTAPICHDLFHPARAPLFIRWQLPLARFMTTGLLPESLREPFGLPWDERRQRRFDAVMALVRAVYPRMPERVRHVPVRVSMWSVRRRLAAA